MFIQIIPLWLKKGTPRGQMFYIDLYREKNEKNSLV